MQSQETINKWIDSLKIALLQKDIQHASYLTQNLPFDNESIDLNNAEYRESLTIAKELISQTIQMLENEKIETITELEKIKKAKKFLL